MRCTIVNKRKIALNRDDDKRLVQVDGITTRIYSLIQPQKNANHRRILHRLFQNDSA